MALGTVGLEPRKSAAMADISQGYENHVPRTVITGWGRCAAVASLAAAARITRDGLVTC